MRLGFALLVFGGVAALAGPFSIAYGVSMGLSSIVRGTVSLQLFGPAGYGAMLGKLSASELAIRVAAPLAFAVMIERAGLSASTAVLVVLSGAAAPALLILARADTGRLRGCAGLCEYRGSSELGANSNQRSSGVRSQAPCQCPVLARPGQARRLWSAV